MIPVQTSLIPATISLVRFFSENGFKVFWENYPYWYLGSTPYKYLIGPVVPILFSNVLLLSTSIYFVIAFIVLSGAGWILLIRKFKVVSNRYLLIAIYLFLPWKYLSGMALSEFTTFVAFCLLPFVLLTFGKKVWLSSLAVAFLLLINTNIIISLLVGVTALAFARGKKRLKKYLISVCLGILIATLWYGPVFWWVQIVNPGIGGGNFAQFMSRLLDFGRNIIPLVLAVTVVKFKSKFDSKFAIFAWIFFGTFAILTVFRFMANPYFWMDWTSWFTELEVGLFLIVATNKKLFYLLICSWAITFLAYNGLGKPALFSTKPPQIVNSLPKLASLAGDRTVFVTGSNVFWLNAYFDTVQVRGGRDEVALDPNWRAVATNLRESNNPIILHQGLEKLNVSYVLVNATASADLYKDYKNLNVWPEVGTVAAEGNGDVIYKVK